MKPVDLHRRTQASAAAAFSLALLAFGCGAEPYHRQTFVKTPDGGQASGGDLSNGAAGSNGEAGTTGAAGATAAGETGGGGTPAAAGAGGIGSDGGAPPPSDASAEKPSGAGGAPPCPGCKITVSYTCLSDAPDQATFVMDVANDGAAVIVLGDLTLRYWYTADLAKPQELDCDDARMGCARVLSRFGLVTPARTGANEYVEFSFAPGAVSAMTSTGRIQVRLRNHDYTQIDQTDDYSQDCANRAAHVNPKITAYLKGALVGGVEP
jgi:endoglucanase